MKHSTKKLILLIFSGMLLSISGLAIIFLLSGLTVSNWIVNFSITNRASSNIEVTPIGIWHSSEKLGTLPLSFCENPAWPRIKRTNFNLISGESMKFYFDYDDINMDGIVVKRDDDYAYIPVLLGFENDHFEVNDFDNLDPVTPEMVALTKNGYNWEIWAFIFLGVMNIPFFIIQVRNYRREKKNNDTPTIAKKS